MEVRADWPVRPGHDAFCWLYYTVEKMPEIIIESNAVYVLEYEVKTNTWSLFRLEKVNNTIRGCEFVEERVIYSEGYVSDNHLWFWKAVIIIL